MRVNLLPLLVGLALLAGCLGASEDDDLLMQRAEVTDDQGGVEGIITNEAVEAVQDATVRLQGTSQETQTAGDGSFALSLISPGDYTLLIEADGYIPAERSITIAPGDITFLDIVLTSTPSTEAYTVEQELVGFVECGIGWSTDPNPLPGATSNAVALCAVPNIAFDNSTNDRFMHFFELDPPIETLVYELTWESQEAALSTNIEIDGFTHTPEGTLFVDEGLPPITTRLDRDVFEATDQAFQDRCEGANGTEQNDAFCGYNFFEDGWPMQTRVFASGDCQDIPARACPLVQERFSHLITAFYHEPAPDGFSQL